MASATHRKCANPECNKFVTISGRCRHCRTCAAKGIRAGAGNQYAATTAPVIEPAKQIEQDRIERKSVRELTALKVKYNEALKNLERYEQEREAMLVLQYPEPGVIEPRYGHGTSEGTAVVLASDWHLEELVDPKTINNMNSFNLDIAHARTRTFFNATARLVKLLQADIRIETLVVGLLGDFISGRIHEEVEEMAQLPPMEAIAFAQDRIIEGIDFLLNHTKLNLRFQCHSGNHARTTHKTRFAAENGHSLEYLMYRHLAAYYRAESRVVFEVADGPHSYLTIYGKKLRFQHGHMVKYQGGVGGLTIPTNKAIAMWNQGVKADLDLFGHFHTDFDGNNFIANGSLIGFNAFAVAIKAPFDVPKQTLFLMDKKRGRTCKWPILFE